MPPAATWVFSVKPAPSRAEAASATGSEADEVRMTTQPSAPPAPAENVMSPSMSGIDSGKPVGSSPSRLTSPPVALSTASSTPWLTRSPGLPKQPVKSDAVRPAMATAIAARLVVGMVDMRSPRSGMSVGCAVPAASASGRSLPSAHRGGHAVAWNGRGPARPARRAERIDDDVGCCSHGPGRRARGARRTRRRGRRRHHRPPRRAERAERVGARGARAGVPRARRRRSRGARRAARGRGRARVRRGRRHPRPVHALARRGGRAVVARASRGGGGRGRCRRRSSRASTASRSAADSSSRSRAT